MTSISSKVRVDQLFADPTLNRSTNDYSAYLRSHNPALPGIRVALQYKFDVREAKKLVDRVSTLPVATQKAVVTELLKRSVSGQAEGGLALTRAGAAALTDLATTLGLSVKFASGQARPIHPVG